MRALPLGALSTVSFAALTLGLVAPAGAQTAQPAQEQCNPSSPSYDKNTGNCVQQAEGAQAQPTAPGTNPGTAPSDEAGTIATADSGQEVVVTGSRIPRPQFEGTIPGAQVTQEQITTRAFTSALEALNDIPLVGPGASPNGTNGAQPGSLGASFVDLLDLGTARTLTLVNGRRFVSGNQGTLFVSGNVTGSQVDLNVIPTALISRFDVLTVGGAAAYGSDAIAGVVNAILIDDYDGVQFGAISGISDRGDLFNYRLTALAGKNFLDKRANVTVSYERVFDDALTGDRRPEIFRNPIAPTFFGNGGRRNTAFAPVIGANTNAGTGAFLPSFSDQVAGNIAGTGLFGGTILVSRGGVVFNNPGNLTGVTQGSFAGIPGLTLPTAAAAVGASVAGNQQIIPGTPVGAVLAGCSITNLTNFCNFAPTALPAGTAAQQATFANAVITRFAPTVTTGTQAERNALAVQLLQANRQTPREFFAANPNVNPNLFLGQFITLQQGGLTNTPAFLTVPNTDTATATLLPRRAVPLAFNDAGDLIDITNCTTPSTPATAGGSPCSNVFQNPSFFNVLRVEQRRDIGNLFAHFDITDNFTVYTEALLAKVETISPQNNVASANSIASTTAENGALLFSINNPFLDAGDRARLIAAGVNGTTGSFLLSRTNQDLAPNGKLRITNFSDTYRVVGGVKGAFGLLGQTHRYDASVTFGRNDANYNRIGTLDVEYQLALDAVRDPASGQIVCRSQIDRAGALGARNLPRGITSVDIIRVQQPDGSFKETIVQRFATDAQIAACKPLNPFGFGQMSEESRNYVTANTQFKNRNDQLFTQASLAGSLFDLPGGKFGYAFSGEYRKDKVDFQVDPEFSATGRTRSAVLARTQGTVENVELGAEARIPIFGDDFNFPLLRNLDLNPAVRFVKQTGDAPDVTLLNGRRLTNEADSGWNRIYSLAATYRPIRDITVRGNVTRSLRQPSVVELFLGGQPAFNAYTDPCSNNQIGGGNTPTLRRSNCQQAVIAAGFATNAAEADTFLASFVNPGSSIQGSFSGSPDLKPERGRSWTAGVAANPSFIPGLRLSADYIDVKLLDRIIPTNLTQALQLCFDSTTFGDTTGQVGVNTCTFFTRAPSTQPQDPAFIPQNGFASGFINLGALQVNALNMTGSYTVPINEWFGRDVGSLELYANAYHLIHYKTSSTGNLNDRNVVFDLAGSAAQPDWEVQGRVRYEHPSGIYGQWTTNYTDKSCAIGTADVCATNEEFDLLTIPSIVTHDLSVGISFGEKRRFGMQLAISNLFDKRYVVNEAQAVALGIGGGVDTFGRRFRLSTNVRF